MAEVEAYEEPHVVYQDDTHTGAGDYEAQGDDEAGRDFGADQTQHAEEGGRKLPKIKMTGTPAPGQYHWDDDVHLHKRPVWSMNSPQRKNLDFLVCTWTPASQSLQPRAPDPTAYGCITTVGPHGKYFAPEWSAGFSKATVRPCLAPPPPEKIEIPLNPPSTLCGQCIGHARHPPKWSLMGKDRSQLPAALGTWTPCPSNEIRPGPGTYDVNRKQKWKASSRRGTFTGRTINLHPDETAWVPRTFGSKMMGGEYMRFRPSHESVLFRQRQTDQLARSRSSPASPASAAGPALRTKHKVAPLREAAPQEAAPEEVAPLEEALEEAGN